MSEAFTSVLKQEFRIPSIEDHEIKYIKESVPFGNPF